MSCFFSGGSTSTGDGTTEISAAAFLTAAAASPLVERFAQFKVYIRKEFCKSGYSIGKTALKGGDSGGDVDSTGLKVHCLGY